MNPVASNGTMHTIERQVLLRAPRSRVWQALTEIGKFCEWFGVDSADGAFEPGARIHMHASAANGGDFDVLVEQMLPEQIFSWRWHPGARDASVDYSREPTTLVTFKLADAPGGTLLTITESGFDNVALARRARVFGENIQGWADQVRNLQRYVDEAI